MPLAAGDKLGPYEILGPLGAGGMGAVYRARDTRLGRDVAIKISSAQFTDRFEREARAVAALNHPNICHLYDVGASPSGAGYLVMELIEGQTLTERIRQGPIPLEEALQIAAQIRDALEAAHEKLITHRDLKPGNIMLTSGASSNDVVKVLDFGLAKQGREAAASSSTNPQSPTMSPTLSIAATEAGMILGTAAYMAPEQAKGRPVDKRADIWAFGVVLYEMLTGERPFHGEDVGDIMASVIKEQPKFEKLPAKVRPLIESCLEKDPKNRLRDIGDAWKLLDAGSQLASLQSRDREGASTAPSPSRLGKIAIAAAAVFALAAIALGFVHFREKPPSAPELTQFQIFGPERTGATPHVVLSPDGRQLIFTGIGPDGRERLWLRNLDSLEARPLPGTEGPTAPSSNPFWSPDSRYVAFSVDGKLKKIPVSGGAPQFLCDIADGDTGGGSWSQEGVILIGSQSHGLYRVSASGGVITPVTVVDPSRQERFHRRPVFLPDGRHFLYVNSATTYEKSGIYWGSLDVKAEEQGRKRILSSPFSVAYAPGPDPLFGEILFLQDGTLMAQRFDATKGVLAGEPIPVAEQVGSNGSTTGYFAASDNGTLAYRSGSGILSRLTWFDRQGTALDSIGEPAEYGSLALSPDGKRIAVARRAAATSSDIWLFDVGRPAGTRFTFDPARRQDNPTWSRDGKQIAFMRSPDLYRKSAEGAGNDEVFLKSADTKFPSDWSPDGTLLFTDLNARTRWDLLYLRADGDNKPVTYLATPFAESDPQFSPDGRWVVYRSDESGRGEIYVRPFPNADGGKWLVSDGGGEQPRWRKDGREILYMSPDGKLMSVEITISGSTLRYAAPKALFVANAPSVRASLWHWDVTADGQRFLIATEPEGAGSSPITIVLNWRAGLKK